MNDEVAVPNTMDMFKNPRIMDIPDPTSWDISKVTNLKGMFSGSHAVGPLDFLGPIKTKEETDE